jgi:mono/diheme cytochrome c family protein
MSWRIASPRSLMAALAVAAWAASTTLAAEPKSNHASAADLARGKYLVRIAGCNDCHTPGYLQTDGKVEEKLWLTGSPLGWRGPWGTTYASNLRLVLQSLSEEQWLKYARAPRRPPMPWFNLAAMSDRDLRAIYAFVRKLGPTGEPAPAYLPPDQEPKPPFVTFPAPPK